MSTPTVAANAYAALARMTDAASALARGARPDSASGGEPSFNALLTDAIGSVAKRGGETGGPSFNALLTDAIGSVVKAGHASDAQTQSVAAGKANIVDVVTAVADTEAAIETMVSVRDKVIQAYQAIMQMPI
ncbi:MAG: flagellar hook-basal body complex protein FliE [Xanthobacteraceae bacterium]